MRKRTTVSAMDMLVHALSDSSLIGHMLDTQGKMLAEVSKTVTEAVTTALLQRCGDATQEELAMASLIVLTHTHQSFQDALRDLSLRATAW